MEEKEPSHTGVNVKLDSHNGEFSMRSSSEKPKLVRHPAVLTWHISEKNLLGMIYANSESSLQYCYNIQDMEAPKCPLTEEG